MNPCIPCEKDFSQENIDKNGPPLSLPGEAVLYSGDYDIIFGITEGDNLNTIVAKIAAYFGTTTTSTTSTSTSTSSTSTSTSTSSTSSTSTSTSSTSSTTTSTTTAAPLDIMRYGFIDAYGTPNASQILAGVTLSGNATNDVVVPFNTLTSGKFYFFWTPDKNNSQKNYFIDTGNSVNQGPIGTEADTFGPYVSVTVGGIAGSVTTGQYATTFPNPITLTYQS